MATPKPATLNEIVIKNIDSGIVIVDKNGQIHLWNRFMEKHSGIKASEITGKIIFDVFAYLPKHWLELKIRSVCLLKSYSFISWTQNPFLFQFTPSSEIIAKDFDNMYQDCTFIPVTDNNETYACIIVRDVTEIMKLNRKIDEMTDLTSSLTKIANYDALTSVANRGHIENLLNQEFKRSMRYDSDFALLMFDIDHFKKVNDVYGHLAGDEALKEIARTISEEIRETDHFGRYGGEEFIIILPNSCESETGFVAEKLRKKIEAHAIEFETTKFRVSISIGFVLFSKDMKDYLQMLQHADLALYHSKKSGRNKISVHKNNSPCLIDKPLLPL